MSTKLANALRDVLALADWSASFQVRKRDAYNNARAALAEFDEETRRQAPGAEREALLERARNQYATSDDVEIYDDARVSVVEGGAWVEAWVWLYSGDDA